MKTAFALALLAFVPQCPAQDQLADALRKAIVEEDVNHNLNAAIKSYQSIVQRFHEDRTAAATAQFRLAECYRKLGETAQADAAYNQLIAQFPDQAALVERSRRQVSTPDQPSQNPRQRAILEEKLDLVRTQLNQVQRRAELGAAGITDLDLARIAVLRAQSDVLALDRTARRQQRAVLQEAVELARKILAAEEKKYQMGASSTQDVAHRKSELLDLQLTLEIAENAK
jgi:tetratricopeptide (TPR) repeat protein